jgi:hypothetical protein
MLAIELNVVKSAAGKRRVFEIGLERPPRIIKGCDGNPVALFPSSVALGSVPILKNMDRISAHFVISFSVVGTVRILIEDRSKDQQFSFARQVPARVTST